MALIRCPECNREISSTVKNCPQCGCNVVSMLRNRFKVQIYEFDSEDKIIYSFEFYPQNGNVGVLYLNQVNALADYCVKNDILVISYLGHEDKYILTPFGFIKNKEGVKIPDGNFIDYIAQNVPVLVNTKIQITFRSNGTGLYVKTPMKYYKSDNFIITKVFSNYGICCEKFIKYKELWYCGFYATMNMNGRSDLIQEYNELINHYNNDKGKTQNVAISSVACPYCHSRNTSKIGAVSRMFSAGFFGLGSKKIGKQWHCNSCNSDF